MGGQVGGFGVTYPGGGNYNQTALSMVQPQFDQLQDYQQPQRPMMPQIPWLGGGGWGGFGGMYQPQGYRPQQGFQMPNYGFSGQSPITFANQAMQYGGRYGAPFMPMGGYNPFHMGGYSRGGGGPGASTYGRMMRYV